MAEFNSCAKLVDQKSYAEAEELYERLLEEGKDPAQTVFDLQLKLQTELAEKLPEFNQDPTKLETMGDILDWTRKNEEAIRDEFRELYNAMGQMSKGEKAASSIWKAWKKDHVSARAVKFEDFSAEDRLELMFELTDIHHFITNIFLGLKFDAKEMFILYALKQQENLRRYNSGY
jgi:hypothetical protein